MWDAVCASVASPDDFPETEVKNVLGSFRALDSTSPTSEVDQGLRDNVPTEALLSIGAKEKEHDRGAIRTQAEAGDVR